MARQSFTTTISDTRIDNGKAETISDASKVTESSSGTSRRKPSGWIPPTAYTFSRTRYDRHTGNYRYRWRFKESDPWTTNRVISGCWGGGSTNSLNVFNEVWTPKGIPQSMVDQAIVKARLAMKDQSVNLAQAFAERNRTVKLVGDTALQLANAYRKMRRGDWKGAGRALGMNNPRKPRGSSVTNRWLEYQYGWKPLLSDVYGSCEALAKLPNSHWCVTGKGSVLVDDSDSGFIRTRDNPLYGRYDLRAKRGVFVRIDAIPSNDMLLAFNSLGLTNPAQLAWELVPYSFVVDWFLPIGDWLASMDAMLGYGPTWCSISRLEKATIYHETVSTEFRANGAFHDYDRKGDAWKDYVRLNRTVSTSVPLPHLPRFKDPRSLGHMANGLALLSQAFGRKAKR